METPLSLPAMSPNPSLLSSPPSHLHERRVLVLRRHRDERPHPSRCRYRLFQIRILQR